jgi:hypothetical protein
MTSLMHAGETERMQVHSTDSVSVLNIKYLEESMAMAKSALYIACFVFLQ